MKPTHRISNKAIETYVAYYYDIRGAWREGETFDNLRDAKMSVLTFSGWFVEKRISQIIAKSKNAGSVGS